MRICLAFLFAAVACAAAEFDDLYPAWSPDGTQLAFNSNREGTHQIHLVELATGHVHRLTNGEPASGPAWLPDGSALIFDRPANGSQEIFRLALASGSETQLTSNPKAFDAVASVSPDGQWIAFDSNRLPDELAKIFLMRPDGTHQHILFTTGASVGHAAWSPDGMRIAFRQRANAQTRLSELHVFDRRSGEIRALTANGATNASPAWSPDGTRLVFTSTVSGDPEVHMLQLDTGELRQLTNSPGNDYRASFSPNGKLIAFCSNRNGRFRLYVMNADGTDVRAVTQ